MVINSIRSSCYLLPISLCSGGSQSSFSLSRSLTLIWLYYPYTPHPLVYPYPLPLSLLLLGRKILITLIANKPEDPCSILHLLSLLPQSPSLSLSHFVPTLRLIPLTGLLSTYFIAVIRISQKFFISPPHTHTPPHIYLYECVTVCLNLIGVCSLFSMPALVFTGCLLWLVALPASLSKVYNKVLFQVAARSMNKRREGEQICCQLCCNDGK